MDPSRYQKGWMNRVFRQRKELRMLPAPANTALATLRLTWRRHTTFSQLTRTECGYIAAGFSGTEMSQSPWSPPSLLCCSLQAASPLKIPNQLGQEAQAAAELRQLLLVSFIPKKIFTISALSYWSELHSHPHIS